MSATVLLTGASGYVGGAVAARLRASGCRVLTLGRRLEDDLYCDFTQPESVAPLVLPAGIEACAHFGAAHEVAYRRDPVVAMTVNVTATRGLLEACARARIPRFVYGSTFHVVGRPAGIVDETTPAEPVSDYGLTHWLAEETLRLFIRQGILQGSILRPSNLFGAPANWHTFSRWTLAPFDFIRQAMLKGEIRLRTDGSPIRNCVSLNALADAAERAIHGRLPPLVHVAGRPWTMKALAELAAQVAAEHLGTPVPVVLGADHPNEPAFQFRSNVLQVDDASEQAMRAFLGRVSQHLHRVKENPG
jgi:UDP-glucose 4-epimerase